MIETFVKVTIRYLTFLKVTDPILVKFADV